MKTFTALIFSILLCQSSQAQYSRYLIKFKDKANSPYSLANPGGFLSQRAIDRRSRQGIAIDSSDLPINLSYIDSVRLSGNVRIQNASKWLNEISIQTTDANAISRIQQFPFVQSALPIATRTSVSQRKNSAENSLSPIDPQDQIVQQPNNNFYNYGNSWGQVKIHKGQFLHNHGFRGQNMQMAIIDAGFFNYNILPTFDSTRLNNRILGTWDFVAEESSVAEDDSHGMHCLSTIAANLPGVFVGTAPQTSFYLFRSEDAASEYPIEEHNLAAAAERADSLGVDICSISLGYSTFDDPAFDYTYSQLNGNTTISAKAVDIASKKGMLMIAAAGNEGSNSWHYIITPADADSVMAVGAVDTLGNIAAFSSYGPSSDRQVKPAVAAVGRNAVVANNFSGLPNYGSGTSYACPNMAGITTCLWQAFPEAGNMEIINTLEASASQYNSPDDRKGYGIPDAKKAFVLLQKKFYSGQFSFRQCKIEMSWQLKTDSSMHLEVERKFPGTTEYQTIANISSNDAYGIHQLNYTDELNGTDYSQVAYRFKIIIGSDTTYYLDSTQINYLTPCNNPIPVNNSLIVFPNPAKDFLYLNIERTASSILSCELYNESGQKVKAEQFNVQAGSTTKEIDLRKISKGVYFLKIIEQGKVLQIKKIVKG